MKIYKIVSSLLIFILLFGLAACNKQEPLTPPTFDSEPTENQDEPPFDSEPTENQDEPQPQGIDVKIPYVKQYAYPDDMNFSVMESKCDPTDGGADFNHTHEYSPIWFASKRTVEGRGSKSYTLASSENISGGYTHSMVNRFDNFLSHEYEGSGNIRSFTLSSKTEKPTAVSWKVSTENTPDSAKVSESFCVEKCREFLSQFVDPQDYEVTYEWNENLKSHTVTFTKMIHGLASADRAIFCLTLDGNFYWFTSTMLGEMSKDMTVNLDLSKCDQAALAKAEEVSLGFEYDHMTFEISDRVLTLDENNEWILVYCITVDQYDYFEVEGKEGYYSMVFGGVLEVVIADITTTD